MVNEEELYEPIRKTLEEKFNNIGECYLEVTAQRISDKIRKGLDDHSVFILETEEKKPDIMGFVQVYSQLGYIDTRLIVVEVKNKSLTLRNIYQIKMYAEIFQARYAFLISPQGFSEARRRFLKYRYLLNFEGTRNITIMKFLNGNILKIPMVIWYKMFMSIFFITENCHSSFHCFHF